jgi:hypothetical protein
LHLLEELGLAESMGHGLRREGAEVLIATLFDFFSSSFAVTTTSSGDPFRIATSFF